MLEYTSVSRKKGQIKPFSLPRLSLSGAIPFSIELTPVASPPTRLYIPRRPAVNVFQGGTQSPSPPWLSFSQTAPNFSPLSTSTLTISPLCLSLSLSLSLSLLPHRNPPNSGSRVCLNERIFLSLPFSLSLSLFLSFSRDPSPCFSCLVLPQRENTSLSLSLSLSLSRPFSVLFVSTLRIPDVLFVPLSCSPVFSFPLVSLFLFRWPPTSSARARVCSLFVLEIRSGLPNPLFSCAVINYYLLAIHPSRTPNELYREIKSLLWNFVFATILSPPPASSSIMGLNFGGGHIGARSPSNKRGACFSCATITDITWCDISYFFFLIFLDYFSHILWRCTLIDNVIPQGLKIT